MWGRSLCAFNCLLPLASSLWEKINSTFWLPSFLVSLLHTLQGSQSARFIHHLCTTSLSLTLHKPVPCITLHLYLLTVNRTIVLLQHTADVICSFPRVIVCSLLRLPPTCKSQGNLGGWRKSKTKESGDREEALEEEGKCSCHCRYLAGWYTGLKTCRCPAVHHKLWNHRLVSWKVLSQWDFY